MFLDSPPQSASRAFYNIPNFSMLSPDPSWLSGILQHMSSTDQSQAVTRLMGHRGWVNYGIDDVNK